MNLVLGETISEALLVKSCEKKVARNGKPYLIMQLFTGTEDIAANRWDYFGDFVPEKNCILNVVAKVTDFSGKLQLTISDFSINTTVDITEFMPRGDFSINNYRGMAASLISEIESPELKRILTDIFSDDDWLLAPAAKGFHHAYVAGNLKHSVDTALKARVLALTIPSCSKDLCIAGALLHDVGKLYTYRFDQVVIDMTNSGMLLDHIVLGVQVLEGYRNINNTELISLLQHIIVSHHGEASFGSPVAPKCIEALVVSICDNLDAKVAMLQEEYTKLTPGAELTGKMWAFGNHPMFTQYYVNKVLNG